jgi:lipoprotein-anchoring transpeptidase ErfK/SrfK
MKKQFTFCLTTFLLAVTLLSSCDGNESSIPKRFKKMWSKLDYKKKKAKQDSVIAPSDTTNIFDNDNYDPKADTANRLLEQVEEKLEQDSAKIKEIGHKDSGVLNNASATMSDTGNLVKKDTATKDIKKMDSSELLALKYNLEKLKQSRIPLDSNGNPAKQAQCKVWAKVSKKDQRLYLFIDGEPVDTFKVSSGDKQHETPNFDTRVDGRMFKKYTSKKYPGGNYNGLGNMPYVVFIRGGYALHGTTLGNIPKLGRKASHGCVRLHPNNAKIFFELVQNVGPENVWVTISN